MPFSGVNHEHIGSASGREDIRTRSDGGLETRNVVAERGTEAARLQKVPLHINDYERRSTGIDGNRHRLRFYGPHWHDSLRLPGRVSRANRCGGISSVIECLLILLELLRNLTFYAPPHFLVTVL